MEWVDAMSTGRCSACRTSQQNEKNVNTHFQDTSLKLYHNLDNYVQNYATFCKEDSRHRAELEPG